MKRIEDMSGAEVRRAVMGAAWGIASLRYARRNPGCRPDEAEDWADQHWPEFESQGIDFLTMILARREAEEAAPNN